MKAGKPGHHYDEDSHQWLPDDAPADSAPAAPAAQPKPAAPKE
jgi:hypothetical protein